jgi:hypothetical protein
MMALFPDFDPLGPQAAVNRQLLIVFGSLNRRDLLGSFQLKLLRSLALFLKFEQLFVLWKLLQALP